MFVGGSFTSVAGGSIKANYIATWDGNSWNVLGNSSINGVDGIVQALVMNGTNNLFVGGQFRSVAGNSISANYIATWDGNSWNMLGTDSTNNGVDGTVYAFAMNGTNQLFVGGQFTSVNGKSIFANYIASWDGNSWNILGNSSINGVDGTVYALAMNGTNQLFVGGQFASVNGKSIFANYIAFWDGNSWNILGNSSINGVDGQVNALAMNGTNQLFVGGRFTSIYKSSISANYVASWNGNSWNMLGTNTKSNGVDNVVYVLAIELAFIDPAVLNWPPTIKLLPMNSSARTGAFVPFFFFESSNTSHL